MTTERLGIVGGGQMGSGIGEVAAKAGIDVVIIEALPEIAERSQGRITASLEKAVSREKISQEDADATLGRLRFGTDLSELADRQFVIEAVVENLELKEDIFTKLDAIVTDPEAILASNTSSIPIIKLAAKTSRPDKVLGTHFFNPVPVMALLELVQSLKTSEDTLARARSLGEQLGKKMISVKGPGRLHRQLPAGALHRQCHQDVRSWFRYGRGHRQRNEARREPPDGTAGAGRLHWTRHNAVRPRGAVRRIRRPLLRGSPVAAPHGRRRSPRPQDRRRLLPVLTVSQGSRVRFPHRGTLGNKIA